MRKTPEIASTFCAIFLMATHLWGLHPANAGEPRWTDAKKIMRILESTKSTGCSITLDEFSKIKLTDDSCLRTVLSLHIKSQHEKALPKDRATIRWGSGVLIANNLVMTNHHVIDDPDLLDSTIILADHFRAEPGWDNYRVEVVKPLTKSAGLFYTDPTLDVTIFEVKPVDERPIAVGRTTVRDYLTSRITSAMSGGGQYIVSDNRGKLLPGSDTELRYDAISFPGASGGGIFDANGKLLGIHRMSELSSSQPSLAKYNIGVPYPTIWNHLRGQSRQPNPEAVATTRRLKEALEAAQIEFTIESIVLGLPPGHEKLTREAIRRSGIPILVQKEMARALINGNVDVDYPTYWLDLPNFIGLYQSHYGAKQFRHAMLTSDEFNMPDQRKRAEALEAKLDAYFLHQVDKFIRLEDVDRQQAARELGQALHTIQDSFSESHTERTDRGIKSFYYYPSQNKKDHEKKDLVWLNGKFTTAANNAINATVNILRVAYSSAERHRKDDLIKLIAKIIKLDEGGPQVSERSWWRSIFVSASKLDPAPVVGNVNSVLESTEPEAVGHKGQILRPPENRCCPPDID